MLAAMSLIYIAAVAVAIATTVAAILDLVGISFRLSNPLA